MTKEIFENLPIEKDRLADYLVDVASLSSFFHFFLRQLVEDRLKGSRSRSNIDFRLSVFLTFALNISRRTSSSENSTSLSMTNFFFTMKRAKRFLFVMKSSNLPAQVPSIGVDHRSSTALPVRRDADTRELLRRSAPERSMTRRKNQHERTLPDHGRNPTPRCHFQRLCS